MRLRLRRPRLLRRRSDEDLPPASWRQRLFIAIAAVAITVVVGLAIVAPQLELLRHKQEAAVPRPCTPGQTSGCVGGMMGVIVAPSPAASR